MNYRALGRTGISVSEIGFGAWGIGGRTVDQTSYGDTDDDTSRAALARAHEAGITFFDTSPAYGNGHSEALIGEALARARHDVVVATKAGYDAWDRPPDFSASAIVASAERSLRRLRSDYVDLFLLHNAPLDVLMADDVREALARLVASGKVRAWGLSAKGPADALAALRTGDVEVIQANFNMMDVRAVTSGLFEEVSRSRAGFIARTPLCFGFLSGTVTRDTQFPAGDHRLGWPAAQLANWIDGARDLLAAVSAAPGAEGVQAALRFCLSFAEVSTTIPGMLTPAEAAANAAVSALGALPPQAVEAVLEINRSRQFFVAAAKAS
jgi:aryl-alcohol dehydrogenase-like predicted oxidoreductase